MSTTAIIWTVAIIVVVVIVAVVIGRNIAKRKH